MSSLQASRVTNLNSGSEFPQAAVRSTNGGVLASDHAIDTQQSRPAVNLQQPSPLSADPQQPGPSRLSAPVPEYASPFPQWSESDNDENYTLESEDDMLLAPGQISGLSSSSDETEVLKSQSYATCNE